MTVCRGAPFTTHCGPFLKVEAKNPVAIMDTWKKALSLMAQYLDSKKYSIISVSLDKRIVDTEPFIWRKFKVVPKYTYVVNLSGHEEDSERNFSKEKRNELNKAVKDGVKVSETKEPDDILTLVYNSISNS